MQFYIVHPEPETNAKLLPDYAIKRVNVREGYSIISDIAHRFGITWEGQNKPYNPYHPLTRTFSNRKAFWDFHQHYHCCCIEYERRCGATRKEITTYTEAIKRGKFQDIWRVLPEDAEAETCHYLLTRKAKHLSPAEVQALENFSKNMC